MPRQKATISFHFSKLTINWKSKELKCVKMCRNIAENKIKVLAVVGPTASGKSSLAISLAKRLCGEVISFDSMQIYRGMDIGTAKASDAERAEVPHHLLDIAEPSESRSLSEFATLAHAAIAEVAGRGKLPILCGGTGLYLDNILYDTELSAASGDEAYRDSLADKTNEELHTMLRAVDPASAEATHPNNRRRVIRALEIYHATGVTKTEWDARSRAKPARYDSCIIGLCATERDFLYRRIEMRVDEMMDMGLAEEVARVAPHLGATAIQAIGYKEILRALTGEVTMTEAVADLKTATRRYAKRQMTWFSANPAVNWIDICSRSKEETVEAAMAILQEKWSING